jgi:hypothetical protein
LLATVRRDTLVAVGSARTSKSDPLHVDFVPRDAIGFEGRLGMTEAPGRNDPRDGCERDLDSDLRRLVERYHADVLVTLLERGQFIRDEFVELGLRDLLPLAQRHGLATEWYALPDGEVPVHVEQLRSIVEGIVDAMRAGKVVVVHCRDGLGRSGLVTASCLTALGASVNEALATVRVTRPGAAQTAAHVQCLRAFDKMWRRRVLERSLASDISDLFERAEESVARPSQDGLAAMSCPGAATLVYLGLTSEAAAATERSRTLGGHKELQPGETFSISPGGVLWIGRGAECDVSIGSMQLSRIQTLVAYVAAAEGDLLVVDLGSRLGTWIDGEEAGARFIPVGTEFQLARAFRFRFEAVG